MSKPLASIDRSLAFRMRSDLIAVPMAMSGTTTWVVKDPVTLEHFQFSSEEYALVEWLRQPVSIAEIRRRFADQFAPKTISPQAVWVFVMRLHQANLLIAEGPGQGRELLVRRRRDRARRLAWSWMSLLAIRFRGVDPDAFLTVVHGQLRWLFSPTTVVAVVAVLLCAASLVFGHFAEFHGRLSEVSALFDARNLPWLLLSIGVVKVLHELGHALACKHFGGEVHELGLMLLVFAPCLYCDVSDAWRLASKWQRIAVSAAGMFVEIVLGAIATIVWWYAQPGVVGLVAMNVMVVCTVGTLLVNGNPLLRYDGYYILSDLAETPNLWQRSREVLGRLASGWLLGEPVDDDPLTPAHHRKWLAAYAAASKLYLALVCVAILWSLVQLLYPLHLQNLTYAVGLTVFTSALISPASSAWRLARNPIRRAELRAGRISLIATIGLAAAVALLAMPVNYYVRAPLVLMPEGAARVYATMDGMLTQVLPAGQKVARGEVIGKLSNPDAERDFAQIAGENDLRKLRVKHLERLRAVDPKANDELPTARAALADSQRRLADRQRDLERLTLRSPADGVVLPAPRKPASAPSSTRLATWSGSLLEQVNTGATLEPGALVCLVGNPARLSAELLVDDVDVKRLRPGQSVRLRIDEMPGQVIRGEVVDVSRHQIRGESSAAAAQADLSLLYEGLVPPGRQFASYYKARVRFDAPGNPLIIGGRGEAKVAAERITLARSILRFFAQTFRLPI